MARIEKQFAGRPLIIESGKMARQADGSCTVQFGETMVLCTAVAQDNPTSLPFFPLTVEYRERTYAAGKIPGGYIKREGRPSDKEILPRDSSTGRSGRSSRRASCTRRSSSST
jgi:polyribonucleotide nucleotidyltransferase